MSPAWKFATLFSFVSTVVVVVVVFLLFPYLVLVSADAVRLYLYSRSSREAAIAAAVRWHLLPRWLQPQRLALEAIWPRIRRRQQHQESDESRLRCHHTAGSEFNYVHGLNCGYGHSIIGPVFALIEARCGGECCCCGGGKGRRRRHVLPLPRRRQRLFVLAELPSSNPAAGTVCCCCATTARVQASSPAPMQTDTDEARRTAPRRRR